MRHTYRSDGVHDCRPPGEGHPLELAIGAARGVFEEPHLSMGPVEPGWLRLECLQQRGSRELRILLAMQARSTPEMDLKTRAAILVHRYSWYVSVALAVPYLRDRLVPQIAPEALAFAFGRRAGARVAVRFLETSFATDQRALSEHQDAEWLGDSETLQAHLRLALVSHFTGLIERLHELTGFSRSAMWRLVGDSFAAAFLEAGLRLNCEQASIQQAVGVLKAADSPLLNRQLHFFEVVVPAGTPGDPPLRRCFRARGGCCRIYKVGSELCATCVLEKPERRRQRLSDWLRGTAS